MFQTVGHNCLDQLALAMDLPLYRRVLQGTSKNINRDYIKTDEDEVEDLYELLLRVRDEMGVTGVSVGAILSDYQRVRVEDVCRRLGMTSLAYLYRRDAEELLEEMIGAGMECILIKVACMGLDQKHLGKTLGEMENYMKTKCIMNCCGEGGEYESFTLDCPLFKKRLKIVSSNVVMHDNAAFAPVCYLQLETELVHKDVPELATQDDLLRLKGIPPYISQDFVSCSDDGLEEDLIPQHLDLRNSSLEQSENEEGWFEVRNIAGVGTSPREAVENAFNHLKVLLEERNRSLKDLVRVSMYIADMNDYAEMNREYVTNFGLNPPVRVCVAVGRDCLGEGVHLMLTVRGSSKETSCLHIQGISHWAPANIGPYSQGVVCGEVIHVSGQIGLIPGNMTLAEGALRQAKLALRHTDRVIQAMMNNTGIHNSVQAVCYVTDAKAASAASIAWKEDSGSSVALKIWKVAQLPRGAAVEWEVVAAAEDQTLPIFTK